MSGNLKMTGRKNHPLAARIKRLMQKDEDVGRIASATPVLIGRALELFLKRLCSNIAEYAVVRQAKTVTTGHLKAYVLSDEMMDFLKDIVSTAPDLACEDPHRAKRQRTALSESVIDSTEAFASAKVQPTVQRGRGRGRRGRGRARGEGRGRGRGRGRAKKDPDLNLNLNLSSIDAPGAGEQDDAQRSAKEASPAVVQLGLKGSNSVGLDRGKEINLPPSPKRVRLTPGAISDSAQAPPLAKTEEIKVEEEEDAGQGSTPDQSQHNQEQDSPKLERNLSDAKTEQEVELSAGDASKNAEGYIMGDAVQNPVGALQAGLTGGSNFGNPGGDIMQVPQSVIPPPQIDPVNPLAPPGPGAGINPGLLGVGAFGATHGVVAEEDDYDTEGDC